MFKIHLKKVMVGVTDNHFYFLNSYGCFFVQLDDLVWAPCFRLHSLFYHYNSFFSSTEWCLLMGFRFQSIFFFLETFYLKPHIHWCITQKIPSPYLKIFVQIAKWHNLIFYFTFHVRERITIKNKRYAFAIFFNIFFKSHTCGQWIYIF